MAETSNIKTCSRCKGSGFVQNQRVAHCGIPGLCFKCDGKGRIRVLTAAVVRDRLIDGCRQQLTHLIEQADWQQTSHDQKVSRSAIRWDQRKTPAAQRQRRMKSMQARLETKLENLRGDYRSTLAMIKQLESLDSPTAKILSNTIHREVVLYETI